MSRHRTGLERFYLALKEECPRATLHVFSHNRFCVDFPVGPDVQRKHVSRIDLAMYGGTELGRRVGQEVQNLIEAHEILEL
jgi:hypothetical protein